jgi:hypothetical protein
MSAADTVSVPVKRRRPWLSPINKRRWLRISRRTAAVTGHCGSSSCCSCCQPVRRVHRQRPAVFCRFKGEFYSPVISDYPRGDLPRDGFLPVTDYRISFMQEEIAANGWAIWPPIRYSYRTTNNQHPRFGADQALLDVCQGRALPTLSAWRRRSQLHCSATGTGSAPTIRRATCSPASSTASASPCCSA